MQKFVLMVLSLLGTSCGVFGLGDPDLSISLTAEVDLPSGSVFQVSVLARRHTLPLGTARNVPFSISTQAPASGELPVVVQLLDDDGQQVAATGFKQKFTDDHRHWISGRIGTQRPWGHCIGAVIAVPISGSYSAAGRDSLFVMYGGIPENAIC